MRVKVELNKMQMIKQIEEMKKKYGVEEAKKAKESES